MNKLLTGDELVAVRNQIVCELDEACGMFKEDKLDRKELTRILNKVANTAGWSVELGCEESFYEFGEQRTGKHIRIRDNEGFDLRVYKLEEKGIYRTHYSHYDLQTDAEHKAEAQWEQDAESAYERYYDYKAFMRSMMEDPRAQ